MLEFTVLLCSHDMPSQVKTICIVAHAQPGYLSIDMAPGLTGCVRMQGKEKGAAPGAAAESTCS